jgi:hypothetical protein
MAQITVNGKPYELVRLDDLTLDEAIVLWDYAKISLDQIADMEGFHPGITAALIHVAVARAEPDETAKAIRRTVLQIKVSELNQVFQEISEEVEEVPPPSSPGSSSPSDDSGDVSSTTGGPAPAARPQNGSGSPGSAIGAISDQVTSAP